MRLKLLILLFLLIVSFNPICYAMDILYLTASKEKSTSESLIQPLGEYYGLQIENFVVSDKAFESQLLNIIKTNMPEAIIISGEAIARISASGNFFQRVRRLEHRIPILITAPPIGAGAPELLQKLTTGAIKNIRSRGNKGLSGFYRFSDLKDITHELSGQALETEFEQIRFFEIDPEKDVQTIIQFEIDGHESPYSIFVKAQVEGLGCFFLSQQHQYKISQSESGLLCQNLDCSQMLALAMFMRYACGDYCWHNPGYYANLTIDDPWLTEPYGDVSYSNLLKEMEKADFHTSFAFIPWNYDRSEQGVVSIFRDHPDKFSICIHGNNHDHYEFYKYETDSNDPWPAKSIDEQESNIKQALARMDEFKRLTEIPYDRVMVFPHGIAPENTLQLLKKYNFLATLNVDHVPLDASPPSDLLFRLRPFTMRFGNFLSFKRFSSLRWPQTEIAICLFFGNPLLFSGHHYFFENGIDTFNGTADFVNRLQPGVEWVSMGQMARRMYLLREKDRRNYEVRSFSKCIELKNEHDREITYHYKKRESFHPPVKQVTINTKSHPYEKSGDDIAFSFRISPGETCLVNIEYENDLDLKAVDISKNNSRANRLRWFSDLRDLTMTKYSWGRAIVKGYYGSGAYKSKLKRFMFFLLIGGAAAICGIWALRRRRRKRRT